ncbi:uncharacterized protein MAM_01455 [Metarhizium album ARSEF 1941]|uniref:Cell wall galactomannoprotein n=1 Tax=Metarhizium album (strain ARSEF 1941) TaxID=1081103 RepID=A0A0B2WWT2_METAS|nr:uncharacterized protein MAM_01455 [Metarhizium album ARSEF 1941]KHO00677.1 hypothetical protein MAM_01455 [Metarhizium album ARSEF 1941]
MKFNGIILSFCAAAAAAPLADVRGNLSATAASAVMPSAPSVSNKLTELLGPSLTSVSNEPVEPSVTTTPHGRIRIQRALPPKTDVVVAKAEQILSEADGPAQSAAQADIGSEIEAIIGLLDDTAAAVADDKRSRELLKDEKRRISAVVARLDETLASAGQLKILHAADKRDSAALVRQVSNVEAQIKNVLAKLREAVGGDDAAAVDATHGLLVELLGLLTAKKEAEVIVGADGGA